MNERMVWPESSRLLAALERSERSAFTMPGVRYTEILQDKVSSIVTRLKGTHVERPSVECSLNGLRTLIKCGHLRAALNLSTKLLTEAGQGAGMTGRPTNNSIQTFDIWAVRFQIFMALKMYAPLLEELNFFEELDAPDTYLQYYAEYAPMKGSIVPYSLRLVHAEAPAYSAEPWVAFPRVQRLAQNTKAAFDMGHEPAHIDVWKKRLETVELMKVRLFYKLKRYHNVFTICESLAQKAAGDLKRRTELLTLLVRVALSVGNSACLGRYMELLTNSATLTPGEHALYKCFNAIFYGNYELAKIHAHEANTFNSLSKKFVNNEAVSLFYNGKMIDSLNILLQHDGTLIEPIAVNLSTIADLVTRSGDDLLRTYFINHCDNLCDVLDLETIKIS